MAVKIRLARGGAKKRPFYRVVVANATAPRDGDFLEKVGTYDPMLASDNSERVVLKKDRIEYWLGTGAKPTERVAKFIEQVGVTLPEKVKKEMEVKAKNRKARLSKKEVKEA
ncbi:30S ribosomal protein S16 [Rickettsia sp. 2024-CO-Wats]|uniref:30S ribosomal protein S16 n=1 Tax=unclassified Rickettsia TaxID=114295 RepID=UPI00370DE1BE